MINRKTSQQQGFSLIELMIVVAIVGILAAVAVPSYQKSIQKGHRADAMALLLELTLEMEQFRAANNSYLGAALNGADTGVPDPDLIMPLDKSVTDHYNVRIWKAERNSYMLQARPKPSQQTDICGQIRIGLSGRFIYPKYGANNVPSDCVQ